MPTARELPLLPTPRAILRLGPGVPAPAGICAAVSAALADPSPGALRDPAGSPRLILEDAPGTQGFDAYSLQIKPDGPLAGVPVISGASAGARRAGLHTLSQLLDLNDRALPSLRIDDHAGFQTRAVMLDVSRDRIPTMDHLRGVVDRLSALKFNHLQLYTEHAFAYDGHADVWRGASPITPDEARELDDYCTARGVELSANQNCFGHLARWLRLPRYRPLAEIPGDQQEWSFMHFTRRGPFSLCPVEPGSALFVHELLSRLVPCFKSKRVNIGCDETFDVGWGRSGPAAEQLVRAGTSPDLADARARLFFAFVRDIDGALNRTRTRLGDVPRPMMWGDIALHHEHLLHLLPEGAITLAWEYEPTDKFEPWVRALAAHEHEAWVCPGTSSWRSFVGRTRERRANIADAAEQGARAGAAGYMVCDWGDVGHRQQWPVAFNAITHAAQAAWRPDLARAFDPRAHTPLAFPGQPAELCPWLNELGDVDAGARAAASLRNAGALFNDLHAPLDTPPEQRPVRAELHLWHEARLRLDHLCASRPRTPDPLLDAEIGLTLLRARLGVEHAIAARTPPISASARARLTDLARAVVLEHRRLWLADSRPGGLEDSVAHDAAILRAIDPRAADTLSCTAVPRA